MRILFDTNVLLDFLADRPPHADAATDLFAAVERGRLSGVIGATTMTMLHYLLRRAVGGPSADAAIGHVLQLFDVTAVVECASDVRDGARSVHNAVGGDTHMAEDVAMRAADGRWWRPARVAVWVVLVMSLATWPFSLADLGPNPERVPMWLWFSLAWAWPMCVLVLVWGRVPRWARIALVCVVIPFSALMLFIAVRLGTGYRVQVLEPLTFAGRPIRLAVAVAHTACGVNASWPRSSSQAAGYCKTWTSARAAAITACTGSTPLRSPWIPVRRTPHSYCPSNGRSATVGRGAIGSGSTASASAAGSCA